MRINGTLVEYIVSTVIFMEILLYAIFFVSETFFLKNKFLLENREFHFIIQISVILSSLLICTIQFIKNPKLKLNKIVLAANGLIVDGEMKRFEDFVSITPITIDSGHRAGITNIVEFITNKQTFYILDRGYNFFEDSKFSSVGILKRKVPQIKSIVNDRITVRKFPFQD